MIKPLGNVPKFKKGDTIFHIISCNVYGESYSLVSKQGQIISVKTVKWGYGFNHIYLVTDEYGSQTYVNEKEITKPKEDLSRIISQIRAENSAAPLN